MNKFYSSPLAIISILFVSFVTAPNFYTQTLSAEKIYKQVSDAVVVILSYDSNNELSKQGSGVVINDKGYVVTNYHVLAGNDRIEVFHNKELIPYVDIIGIDVEKDILILKIEEKKFPAIKIGNSEKLSIGQRVYTIGSPLGYENTISEGIISGLRSYEESERNFIQITASISPGSSGGAVVNDKGELIGISTLTDREGQNLNFAIPIKEVLNVGINFYSVNNNHKDVIWFNKGRDAHDEGNYQVAIEYLTIYLMKHPKEWDAFYVRGHAKMSLEDYQGAINDFSKAIELNSYNALLYINRGLAKNLSNDFIGAELDYDLSIILNPNQTDAYINRGHLKSAEGDYEGAIIDYNEAIKVDSLYVGAYVARASVKSELGDYDGAMEDFNKAIEINPDSDYAYNNRGFLKLKLGDLDGACEDWNKVVLLGDNHAKKLIEKHCN